MAQGRLAMKKFVLHSRLEADTAFIGDLALSRALLMDDARFPWIILVPRYAAATEIFDLTEGDRAQLSEEISRCARVLRGCNGVEKINIGALGNLVPQLHVHVVGRHAKDAAWPGPVWGSGARAPYPPEQRDKLVNDLARELRN
jgi:diadenosine tetraphosphate (Ap4A) HIT family hydrolase